MRTDRHININGNLETETVFSEDETTAVRTTYKPDGTVDVVENLTGLPALPSPPVDPVADIMVTLDKLGTDLAAAKDFADVAAVGVALKATAADLKAGVAIEAEVKL